MYYVYILWSQQHDRQYVGLSKNISKRLGQHNAGYTKSTKPYIPWVLVHTEEYVIFAEARKREKYLKSAAGRRWRKANISWPSSSTG